MFGFPMKSEIDPRLNEIVSETRDNTDLDTIREIVKDNIDKEQDKKEDITIKIDMFLGYIMKAN